MAELKVPLTTNHDLLPCPFCGGEALYRDQSGMGHTPAHRVICRCDNRCPCDAHTGFKPTAKEAFAAWNTRAADPSPRDEQGWEAKWQQLQTEIGLTGDGARRVLEVVGYDPAPVEETAWKAETLAAWRERDEMRRQLAAANARLEMALKVLAEHHQWHIDNAAEYCDSSLYERTIAAFAGACGNALIETMRQALLAIRLIDRQPASLLTMPQEYVFGPCGKIAHDALAAHAAMFGKEV